jgi:NAD-dependent DNA ligase
MSKKDFQENYAAQFANARNLVSGIVNAKSLKEGAKHVQFVAYEEIVARTAPPHVKQLDRLVSLGFAVAQHVVVSSSELCVDILQSTLINMKTGSKFDIDGIIVQSNRSYERNTEGNPSYAFAFKMRLENAFCETTVEGVEWNISKRGQLKPRVKLTPVRLSGVTITYATGFNGRFVYDNRLGPGAVVKVTRSGDVIPYIFEVVEKAREAAMPSDIIWKWSSTGAEILAEDENPEVDIQILVNFFSTLGIKFVSDSTVRKLYEAGFDTLLKIVRAKADELETVPGLGLRSAERIVENIRKALAGEAVAADDSEWHVWFRSWREKASETSRGYS